MGFLHELTLPASKDPEVRKLADEIIKTQEKEIAEMKVFIKRLQSEK